MQKSDLVSVVITNFNRRDDLREAVQSIQGQDYQCVEIIVVDNASQDDSLNMLLDEFPNVKTIPLMENIGMDGYSVGFAQASGEFIFQMDNDSLIPTPSILGNVVKRFQEGPPNLVAVATRVEEFRVDHDNIEELRRRDTRVGPINSGAFHSGGVGFRRSLLDQVGYYNRDVFLYGSELFLGMKMLAAGYEIHFFPEILMLHKSSGVSRSGQGTYFEMRNRYWYMRRFASPAQQIRFLPAMIFHDFFYCLHKRSPAAYFRALYDGFRPLPTSLQPPLRSKHTGFVEGVERTGHSFGVRNLFLRIYSRLSRHSLRHTSQ